MRGRQGGIPFTTPPPKTEPGVKGYLGPVVVFMGIRINADRTLRRAANAFGVKFEGKKWIPVQKFCLVSVYEDAFFNQVPSGVTESFPERFKKAEYLWGISTKL